MPIMDDEKRRRYQREWARKKFSDPEEAKKRSERMRRWRAANQEHIARYSREYVRTESGRESVLGTRKRLRRRVRGWYNGLKLGLSCQECGENHPATLDFHHLDPETKDRAVASMISRGWTEAEILSEMSKCVVLCANCHRKLHWDA